MKFIELLDGNKNSFSCEVITTEWETAFSFEWDEQSNLTNEGKKRFNKILNSECRFLGNGNIELLDKTITENELDDFLRSVAGYCSVRFYNIWFEVSK